MKKNICFVANYQKTFFFDAISKSLKKLDIEIFWITTSQELLESLSIDYKVENILYIHKDIERQNPIYDLRLNEIIFSDRSLREQQEWAVSYLENIQLPIYNFIKKNEIRCVFGELTWGHELLILRLLERSDDIDCKYLNPHTVRLPSGFFGFFINENQSTLLDRPCRKETPVTNIEIKKPSYLHLNDKALAKHFSARERVHRAFRFFCKKTHDKKDPTVLHKKTSHFKIKALIEVNKELYRTIRKSPAIDIKGKDYVFFPLHKQPEASVDVIGRYYEDQYINILNIWRALPQGWALVVKEHTNAIGDRPLSFYKKLEKLNNAYLVDETEDSYALIDGAKCVVTISGTAAYEAALKGVPSLTFADTFFNTLENCKKIDITDLQKSTILEILNKDTNALDRKEYEQWLSQRIFRGVISDPTSDPSCMEDENIADVSRAFFHVINP